MKKRKVLPSLKDMEVDEPGKKESIRDNHPTNKKTNNITINITEKESAGKADVSDDEGVNFDDNNVEDVKDTSCFPKDAGKVATRAFFEKNVKMTANVILLQVAHWQNK
eukprot:6851208-Ditylum_brightwellii.AAC.1